MGASEIVLSQRQEEVLCVSADTLEEGRWYSVGESSLCDLYSRAFAPNENLQIVRYADFIGIRLQHKVIVGLLKVEFTHRNVVLALQLRGDEPSCLRKYVMSNFYRFSHIFSQPKYHELKARVLSHFDSQWLSRPLDIRHLSDLSARVAPLVFGDVGKLAHFTLAIFTDVFLEGVLSGFLEDPAISELVLNGDDLLWLETQGEWQSQPSPFPTWDTLERWLLYQSSRAHSDLYTVRNFSDFVLRCGARVHVSLPPVSRSRAYVTIRSHTSCSRRLSQDDFVFSKDEYSILLTSALHTRKNILICGPTGSGKTTLLRYLLEQCETPERILVLEDTPELSIARPHVVYLQTRERAAEHAPAVGLGELVRESLRMRPDRIVVGECRGAEAFALLQALHTGHRGTLCTLHANSVNDALDRFQTLVLQAQPSLGSEVVQRMILSSIQLVVNLERHADGSRRVAEVRELCAGRHVC